jgi:hypothetical protein
MEMRYPLGNSRMLPLLEHFSYSTHLFLQVQPVLRTFYPRFCVIVHFRSCGRPGNLCPGVLSLRQPGVLIAAQAPRHKLVCAYPLLRRFPLQGAQLQNASLIPSVTCSGSRGLSHSTEIPPHSHRRPHDSKSVQNSRSNDIRSVSTEFQTDPSRRAHPLALGPA